METWETDGSRDVLTRIVALLFSLANLADRAAGVSVLRRREVLGILSHGEAVARAFLMGMPVDAAAEAQSEAPFGDARRLAARLRALGLLLMVLLTQRMASPGDACPRAGAYAVAGFAGQKAAAFDTS